MPKRLNFKQRQDRFPPILIRLLTVFGRGRDRYVPDDRELAAACRMTVAALKFVSYSVAWDAVTVAQQRAYLRGCGVDLESRRCFLRLDWMRTHGHFTHLRKNPLLVAQFEEMLEIWENSENE
jgi:hypothetical protein